MTGTARVGAACSTKVTRTSPFSFTRRVVAAVVKTLAHHRAVRTARSTIPSAAAIATAPPASSQRKGDQPIRTPQVRHLPRRARKLTNGMSSNQARVRPQASQCDLPRRDAGRPRVATTPANDPSAPPNKAARMMAKTTVAKPSSLD